MSPRPPPRPPATPQRPTLRPPGRRPRSPPRRRRRPRRPRRPTRPLLPRSKPFSAILLSKGPPRDQRGGLFVFAPLCGAPGPRTSRRNGQGIQPARPLLAEGEEGGAARSLGLQARRDPAALPRPPSGRPRARPGGGSGRLVPDRRP